jgi:hypothetical protein
MGSASPPLNGRNPSTCCRYNETKKKVAMAAPDVSTWMTEAGPRPGV